MLGRSVSAAYEPSARLPGTGILLPAWRQLAQLLAALNHEVPSSHLHCLQLQIQWLLVLHHQAASCASTQHMHMGKDEEIYRKPAQPWTHLYLQVGM